MNALKIPKWKGVKGIFDSREDPKTVAKGFALGSFVGMLPFPGFQVIISAGIAAFFKWNKTAAIAGVFNTNLATGAFVFAFNYWLGKKLLGIESDFQTPEKISLSFARTVFEAGYDVFLSLLLGGLITGILAMFLGYFISFSILKRKHKNSLVGTKN